ncbi:hypothetical protein Tco_1182520 [Tanacetum coccineum]
MPLSKGIVHHPKPQNNLKTSTTSNKKVPIPGMTHAQALTAIQTMADHSQKWHDSSSSQNVGSSNNIDGLAIIDLTSVRSVLSMRKSKEWKRSSMENLGVPILSTEAMKRCFGTTNEALSLSTGQCKAVIVDNKAPIKPTFSSKINRLHRVSFLSNIELQIAREEDIELAKVLSCQLPPKELNLGSFSLPCTIGNFNFYAMADLDFIIIDKTPNETIIQCRPFLATIHAEINVFDKEISLEIGNDRVRYDMEKKDHNFTTPTKKNFMIKSDQDNRPHAPACSHNPSLNLDSENLGNTKDPNSRSFYDYKWVFNLEIGQLADEYELGIGKKGHMLDNIWKYCKKVHKDSTYWWQDHRFKEDERDKMRIEIEEYDPPKVETFEVKRYSFKSGQSFVCVTKELDDTLPLGIENGSRFRCNPCIFSSS